MSLPGTSPRTTTITTTITTTATTSAQLTTVTSSTSDRTTSAPATSAATATTPPKASATESTATTATITPERSSPPKNDSLSGRSKKSVPPRSPRVKPQPVPVLRLRSNSSGQEFAPSPRTLPPLSDKQGEAALSQSHPVPDMNRAPANVQASTTTTLAMEKDATTEQASVRASSEPSLQIIRKSIPLGQLKKMEQEHRMHKLADLIVDDLVSGQLTSASLSTLGRVDSAFYIDHLPEDFKPLAKGLTTSTISSGKLMQGYFAADFIHNVGWNGATSLYANFTQREPEKSSSTSSHVADNNDNVDDDTRQAERERIQGAAEVIVRSLLGYPPTVDSSPLPGKLISLLIACDQRLHAKLLATTTPAAFSTDQIRTGRLAALTHVLVTRLLQPMLFSLTPQPPSQAQMSFQILVLKGLMSGARQLAEGLFNKSFATSPLALQQQATEKATREKIDARIRLLQTKPSTRHVRTRSADTTPVSPRTLRTLEEARTMRKAQQAGELATTLESQDWSALDEASRQVNEKLARNKSHADLLQMPISEVEELVRLLEGKGGDSQPILAIQPRRAQPLDDGDELPMPGEPTVTVDALPRASITTANTFDTFNTTISSTTPEKTTPEKKS